MRFPHAKIFLPLSLCVLIGANFGAQAQDKGKSGGEILTNENIVTMAKAGLNSTIIVSKIHSSKTQFNLSTDELLRLKRERVPDDIVKAMLEASSTDSAKASSTGAGDVSKTDANDPLAQHEAGIYLFEEKDGQKHLLQLEPSISSQSKSGGFFTSAMTYGIAKIKSKAVLANQNARLQIDKTKPIFYFYFEVKNSGLSNSGNVYSASSTSPNEFVLVKMEEKKNGRELIVGQANMFGTQSGTLDKYARPFDYEKLAPGVYKVTPRTDLADGEYGFFYGGSTPLATYGYFGANVSPKIFDFGIKLPR
ncbi:MAG: hypothetical protein ABR577_04635 [Pyrinomonadaceae bacterium]